MKERMKTRKLDPGEINQNDPNIIDVTSTEVEEEIKNLSPEEKEKIGWGLSTIGFKVEKAKNDFFAAWLDPKTDVLLSKINKNSTTGRFCKELRDSFIRDSKTAQEKATKIKSGKEKHRLSNASLLSGNLLRYGRALTDLTGFSLASPLRYVMMGGMATARLAEAGKEARLKNEGVIEKTRIQDADRAYDEAKKIYEKAQKKDANVSAEALKNAYLMEIPKDLQERIIRNPSTANTLIQKIVKIDLEDAIARLNNSIIKIEKNPKLSQEEKELKIEKLITKQKKSLEDYDRIITQYGTVDALAMAGRYAQTAGKAVVAVVTVETLVLSAEKLFGTMSSIYHHFHDAKTAITSGASVPKEKIARPNSPKNIQTKIEEHPGKIIPSSSAPAASEAPKITNNFTNEGIKFERGKGGVQGILDLKKQIAAQYNGDYSKAPESVRDFMNTDATKEAIRLGLFDPSNPNGKESALITAGSVLKFDEQGNLLFGEPDADGKVPVLEKYQGKMFDSDGSAKVSKISTRPTLVDEPKTPASPETPAPKPTSAEVLKEKIGETIDRENKEIGKQQLETKDSIINDKNNKVNVKIIADGHGNDNISYEGTVKIPENDINSVVDKDHVSKVLDDGKFNPQEKIMAKRAIKIEVKKIILDQKTLAYMEKNGQGNTLEAEALKKDIRRIVNGINEKYGKVIDDQLIEKVEPVHPEAPAVAHVYFNPETKELVVTGGSEQERFAAMDKYWKEHPGETRSIHDHTNAKGFFNEKGERMGIDFTGKMHPLHSETPMHSDETPKSTHILDKETKNQAEVLKEKIEKNIANQPVGNEPRLGTQTVHMGKKFATGNGMYVEPENKIPNSNDVSAQTSGVIHTGEVAQTGERFRTGGYPPLGSSYNGYYFDPSRGIYTNIAGKRYFPELSPEDNAIIQKYPAFEDNPFNLSGQKLIQAYQAIPHDLYNLFGNERSALDKVNVLCGIRADKVIEYKDMDPVTKRFSSYLNLLKSSSGLDPKSGFFTRAENSGNYISRALQKLAADGKLEKFEEIIAMYKPQ